MTPVVAGRMNSDPYRVRTEGALTSANDTNWSYWFRRLLSASS